ncbi:MAG: asparagine synthetase B [Candidatus Bathyarchaeia archaeon]
MEAGQDKMRAIVAVFDRKEGCAAEKAVEMLKVLKHNGADAFELATPTGIDVKAEPEQLQVQNSRGLTAVGHVFLKVSRQDKPQTAVLEKAAFAFDGRIYQPSGFCLAESLFKILGADREESLETLITRFEGSFAFALAEPERLVVGRDALGLYPLYYGWKDNVFAVASECKALWKIGVREAKSFPPGHILIADDKGLKLRPVKLLKGFVKPTLAADAVEKLQKLLMQSVVERTNGIERVAVAFSGGLDSGLTAFLARKAGLEVHLIHVSLEDQRETVDAEEAASMLDLPFHKYLYDVEDVEHVLPRVLQCVESPDMVKVSVGLPLYWAAENAAEIGFKVLFSGQGADELFGGYRRYLTFYSRYGSSFAEKAMASDVERLYDLSFERDFKICGFHNVEIRLPFASPPIFEFALSLPLNLKVNGESDTLRKAVLRKTAERLGLPRQIVYKPKRAMQYATGVEKALRKLAGRENLPLKKYLFKVFQNVFANYFWEE